MSRRETCTKSCFKLQTRFVYWSSANSWRMTWLILEGAAKPHVRGSRRSSHSSSCSARRLQIRVLFSSSMDMCSPTALAIPGAEREGNAPARSLKRSSYFWQAFKSPLLLCHESIFPLETEITSSRYWKKVETTAFPQRRINYRGNYEKDHTYHRTVGSTGLL
jgi:hypothetical protein